MRRTWILITVCLAALTINLDTTIVNVALPELATSLDAGTRDLIIASLDDAGQADFAVRHIRGAIEQDPKLSGRLALWGRRLMGEALTQAQRVAAERDAPILCHGIDGVIPATDREGLAGVADLNAVLAQIDEALK